MTTSDNTTSGHTVGNTSNDRNEYNSSGNMQGGNYAQSQAHPTRSHMNTGMNADTDTRDQAYSTPLQSNTGHLPQDDAIAAAPHHGVSGQALDLNHEHEPRTSISQGKRGSLASTEGPFQVPTTDDVSKSSVPPTSSVGQQNAPGRAGSIGEKAMSALGYGGNHVERPKEEQGLGEKIVNFLGA